MSKEAAADEAGANSKAVRRICETSRQSIIMRRNRLRGPGGETRKDGVACITHQPNILDSGDHPRVFLALY